MIVAQSNKLVALCKQVFGGRQTEQVLSTTFWANDWKRGHDYVIDGRTYRVTRYVRCADPRFFDVMGYELQPSQALVRSNALA